MERKIMVMTGGTSGIGKNALAEIIKSKDYTIFLGARNKASIDGIEIIPLDLQKLSSVKKFTQIITDNLGDNKIEMVILNAGISSMDTRGRSFDGFETTFAVNHLSHYLIIKMLLPYVAKNGRIIITSSGTHNPAEKTIIAPPIHANAFLLAYPENDPDKEKSDKINAGRAYSASKLCNILTARFLLSHPYIKNNRIKVFAYDPGPTPGTGLTRKSGILTNMVWKVLSYSFFRYFLPKFNSIKNAGRCLAMLAMGKIDTNGKFYIALRKAKITYPKPSDLAMDDKVMNKLWEDSARLLEINEQELFLNNQVGSKNTTF